MVEKYISKYEKPKEVRDISDSVFLISDRSLREAFKTAPEKGGIDNFRRHDLRHTFATRLVQNGVDLLKVKELLGHKTIAMTMRYAHYYPESLWASVEVLDTCHVLVTVKEGMFDPNKDYPLKSIMREWRNWQTRWT